MKKYLLLFFVVFQTAIFAQIPQITFQDFNYNKQVSQVDIVKYNMEDKVVVDERLETEKFNSDGNIVQLKTDYYSNNIILEKTHNYKNKLIDQTIETNSKRKDADTYSNFFFTDKDQLDVMVVKTNSYKTVYSFKYNKQKKIQEIFAKFGSDYQYETYYYNKKNQLYKKEVNLYVKDTLAMVSQDLFIDNKVVANISSNINNIMFYTSSKNASETVQLDLKPGRTANEFLNLSDLVRDKEMSQEEFRDLILNIKDIKIITQNYYKLNENNDWIAKYSFNTKKPALKMFFFKKINYADGTVSGTEQFDIFTANELKAMQK